MLKNIIMVGLSFVAGRGSIMLAGILLANSLGSSVYAAFTFMHVTAASFANIATLGMQNALPRYFAQVGLDARNTVISQLSLASILASFGLFVVALFFWLAPPELVEMPAIVPKALPPLLLFAIGMNNLFAGATSGLENFDKVTHATTLQGVVLLATIGYAGYANRPEIALWGYLVATLLSIAILYPNITRTIRRQFAIQSVTINGATFAAVASFCGPLFVAGILTNSGLWLAGRSLLDRSGQTHLFSEFAVGLQWFGLISMVSNVVARAVLPRLSQMAFVGDNSALSNTLRTSIMLSTLGSAILFLGILSFSDRILTLYGSEFSSAKASLLIFGLAGLIACPIDVISSALIARNHQAILFGIVFIWWLCLLIFLFMAPKTNSTAVTGAVAMSYVLYLGVVLLVARRLRLLAR